MADEIAGAVDSRCRVALGAILRYKDDAVDPHVPAEVAAELRRVVLREVNGFSEFVLQIVGSVRDDRMAVNALWLDEMSRKIDQLYDVVVARNGNGTG